MVIGPITEELAAKQLVLSSADRAELAKLVSTVALNDHALTLFAIAPESAPNHPIVEEFQAQLLRDLDEPLHFSTLFYSDDSLFNFLGRQTNQLVSSSGRQVIFAFGLEQLPTPRKKQELEQLNLAREKLFEQNIVVVFWLNRELFLNEFRHRAPDFWDWRGNVAVFEARHPLLYPYLEWLISTNAYLTMSGVMQVNRQVDIFLDQIYVSLQAERKRQVSVPVAKGQRVSTAKVASSSRQTAEHSIRHDQIDAIYDVVPELMPEPMLEIKEEFVELERSAPKIVAESVALSDVVRGATACSVILGAPGAGKTTLLKYLALHFARALRDGQATVPGEADGKDLGEVRLPILFKIADYAERLEQNPALGLLEYLQQFYRHWEDYFEGDSAAAADISIFLLEQMRIGNCLILLDGLDEVFDQKSRGRIVERINAFAEQFGHNNKLIVTSRIAGYQEVKLASRFAEFTIVDMSDQQVSDFLHRWCGAIEKAQKPEATLEQQILEGNRQSEQILRDIRQNEGVKRLTTNPLLLTILALIHRNGEQLPERRVKLYELAVQTLTADWQLSKKLPNMQKVLLPEGEVVELLAPLAYWMHEEKPSGQVTHAEVIQQLAPRLADLRGEEAESSEIVRAVEEFLRRVRETTGLFVERSPDVYGFMHLTFEEYFAAREIADKDPDEMLETIQRWWNEPRWEEPTLLALGYYGSYSPRQFNRLANRLFEGLADYQPSLGYDKIALYGGEATARIRWSRSDSLDESQDISLKALLFAGQVIAQVGEVNARLRKALINKLTATGLALEDDSVFNQILQLLRRIESFNRQGEVIEALESVIENSELSKELRLKARVSKLYVLCSEAGSYLLEYVTEIFEAIEPNIFCALKDLAEEMGEEMSPALEVLRQQLESNETQKSEMTLITAISYLREKYYDKSIELLEALRSSDDESLMPYILWSLAICYQEKKDYEKAYDFYQLCFERLTSCIEPHALLLYWRNWGVCQRLHSKYEEALDCFQHMLAIAQETQRLKEESLALYHLGRTYQDWSKYADAIAQHEQSRDRYQQLGKETDVADSWYWIAACYRDWGKYEEAITAEQQELAIREKLDDQPNIASAYFQFGRIYQAWGKYADAITQYEQSRDRYQQLGKETDVANLWAWIADCYRDWGKYEEAIAAQQQDLAIREKLDDQPNIALAYFQFGRIYQAWGKYADAI
ncbi:MAG: histidine kinase, partial [Phormidesmis priestleyi]